MAEIDVTTTGGGRGTTEKPKAKIRDPRSAFTTLAVSPGYEAVKKRLEEEQQISGFMTEVLQKIAHAHEAYSQELQRAVSSSAAKFEQDLPKAFLSLLTRGHMDTTALKEYGTLNAAWQRIREQVAVLGEESHKVASAIESECVVSNPQAEYAKVFEWGDRLNSAMLKYKAEVDRCQMVYHSRCKERKQADLNRANNTSILLSKKMQDAVIRAQDLEMKAGEEYDKAISVAKQKQREFYAIRMPRVLDKMQALSEARFSRTCEALRAFHQIGNSFPAKLAGCFDGMDDSIAACNSDIDARVFVAEQSSSASLPVAYEFVPFSAEDLYHPKKPKSARSSPTPPRKPVKGQEEMEPLEEELVESDIDSLMDGLTLEDIEDL